MSEHITISRNELHSLLEEMLQRRLAGQSVQNPQPAQPSQSVQHPQSAQSVQHPQSAPKSVQSATAPQSHFEPIQHSMQTPQSAILPREMQTPPNPKKQLPRSEYNDKLNRYSSVSSSQLSRTPSISSTHSSQLNRTPSVSSTSFEMSQTPSSISSSGYESPIPSPPTPLKCPARPRKRRHGRYRQRRRKRKRVARTPLFDEILVSDSDDSDDEESQIACDYNMDPPGEGGPSDPIMIDQDEQFNNDKDRVRNRVLREIDATHLAPRRSPLFRRMYKKIKNADGSRSLKKNADIVMKRFRRLMKNILRPLLTGLGQQRPLFAERLFYAALAIVKKRRANHVQAWRKFGRSKRLIYEGGGCLTTVPMSQRSMETSMVMRRTPPRGVMCLPKLIPVCWGGRVTLTHTLFPSPHLPVPHPHPPPLLSPTITHTLTCFQVLPQRTWQQTSRLSSRRESIWVRYNNLCITSSLHY